MKKTPFILATLFFTILAFGQTNYRDDFDGALPNGNTAPGLTTSIINDDFRITGDGTSATYATVEYIIENPNTLNLSGTPTLTIRAKASKAVELRIDLMDDNGYVTNANPTSVMLTTGFQELTLAYAGKFSDGGFGGACAAGTGPCQVDSAAISAILFYISTTNGDEFGAFDGTVDIDWIEFNDQLNPNIDIRYNQIGYATGRKKLISLASTVNFNGKAYEVRNSGGTLVTSGTSPDPQLWPEAGEYISNIDISTIETAGAYTLTSEGKTVSFTISDNPYDAIRKAAFKYYYYNRASSAVTPEYGGAYSWATGIPDTQVYIHKTAALPGVSGYEEGDIISSPGGWYDAGDYGKYIVNSGISTYTLLAAYEHYADFYDQQNFNIPESTNNLPDILDEAKYNLDWMLTMQDPEGGVFHKLTATGFVGRFDMPASYNRQRFVFKQSTAATLDFAAVMATASRIFGSIQGQEAYSQTLLTAAENAYTWATTPGNDNIIYEQNDAGNPGYDPDLEEVETGEYGDTNLADEFRWAATELYITTGEAQYNLNTSEIGGGTPRWPDVDPLALVSLTFHQNNVTGINTNAAQASLINTANELVTRINTSSAMRVGMLGSTNAGSGGDFDWGSNGAAANQLMLLIRAYEATDDNSYLDAAFIGVDYLLGRNSTGYSYVTGFGDLSPTEPHHRLSEGDGVTDPIPGMLVGGPQNFNNPDASGQFGCNINGFPSPFTAKTYVDNWCSFSTNEVTINWNAPLMYVLNALHFYQNGGGSLSTNPIRSISEGGISLYPNPSKGILNISFPEKSNAKNYSIAIYSIQGKKVLETSISSNKSIDISELSKGLYLTKLTDVDGKNYAGKIIVGE